MPEPTISLRDGESLADYAIRVTRERDEALALVRDVARSGVSWTTRDYLVVQVVRVTWDALQARAGHDG